MQLIHFAHKDDAPHQIAMQPIIIGTSGYACEDLLTLIEHIQNGDTPGTRELLATLEDIYINMVEGRL